MPKADIYYAASDYTRKGPVDDKGLYAVWRKKGLHSAPLVWWAELDAWISLQSPRAKERFGDCECSRKALSTLFLFFCINLADEDNDLQCSQRGHPHLL